MMRRTIFTMLTVCVALAPAPARFAPAVLHAGQEPKVPKLQFFGQSVEGQGKDGRYTNLYLLQGENHHSVVLVAEDGVIIVDTKSTPGWGAPIMQRLLNITEQQVTTLINTNPHQGGSNAEFPMVVDVIAHEKTKTRMAAIAGANAKALPNKTFKDKLSLTVKTTGAENGDNRLDLYHFGPGYSDGDTVVVFPQYNSVYLGELWPGKAVPLIDRASGGSAIALPDTLDKAVATLKTYAPMQAVIQVRGVAPIRGAMIIGWNSLKDLEEYVAFTHALVAACRAAHDAGKSVDDAVAGLTLPERFKSYGMDQTRPFVQAVYDELK